MACDSFVPSAYVFTVLVVRNVVCRHTTVRRGASSHRARAHRRVSRYSRRASWRMYYRACPANPRRVVARNPPINGRAKRIQRGRRGHECDARWTACQVRSCAFRNARPSSMRVDHMARFHSSSAQSCESHCASHAIGRRRNETKQRHTLGVCENRVATRLLSRKAARRNPRTVDGSFGVPQRSSKRLSDFDWERVRMRFDEFVATSAALFRRGFERAAGAPLEGTRSALVGMSRQRQTRGCSISRVIGERHEEDRCVKIARRSYTYPSDASTGSTQGIRVIGHSCRVFAPRVGSAIEPGHANS